jgi:O-antigen ligase
LPAVAVQSANPFARLGVALLLLDVFFIQSRLPELRPIRIGPLSLMVAVQLACFAAAFLSGRLGSVFSTAAGRGFALFTFWMLAGAPASSWRSGTLETFSKEWLPSMFLFVSIIALVHSKDDLYRVLRILAFGTICVILIATLTGTAQEESRIRVATMGSLGNSNGMAGYILAGLPALILMVQLRKKKLDALLSLLAIPLAIRLILGTGSRAALLSLLVIFAVLFWNLRPSGKLALAGGMALFGLLAVAAAPRTTLVRLATLLPSRAAQMASSQKESAVVGSAQESRMARTMVLQRGLEMTARHPLFGVGAGAFTAEESRVSALEGRAAMWRGAHNSYIQVLSETGIPGFLFYCFALVGSMLGLRSARKAVSRHPACREISTVMLAVFATAAGVAVGIAFGHVAYLHALPLSLALVEVARRVGKQELADAPAPAPAAFHAWATPVWARQRATA